MCHIRLTAFKRIWQIQDSQGQIPALGFRLKIAFKRIWQIQDSQGQIPALGFRLKTFQVVP